MKEGNSFLDLTAKQVLHMNKHSGSGSKVKFMLMNRLVSSLTPLQSPAPVAISSPNGYLFIERSFTTSDDTKQFLTKYPSIIADPQLELMQNKAPKVINS